MLEQRWVEYLVLAQKRAAVVGDVTCVPIYTYSPAVGELEPNAVSSTEGVTVSTA